ncbi:MAG: nuclear transport factor 2 family protein [Sterolibacterium sp.]|nr:nuclear transport factor 2 family protein [Sterolibacterium sp.]
MVAKKTIFSTPQDAEAAFYDAIERADLDALMAVWAEDEEIVCIQPGGPRMTGYANVREVWRRIFETGQRFVISMSQPVVLQGMLVTVHSLCEQVSLRGGSAEQTAPLVATNVYVRGAHGWRLLVHHASPAPPEAASENPKTLH